MLTEKIENALNGQIEKEIYSSNLYLSMASWAENHGLSGTAQWMYLQAEEEKMHMLKFVKYINDRGAKAIIPAVPKPPVDYSGVKELFAKVLDHENYITSSINEIVGLCLVEKDFTTHNWIQWFVMEQIEEEASVRGILDKLALIGDNELYHFERDVASMRTAGASGTGKA